MVFGSKALGIIRLIVTIVKFSVGFGAIGIRIRLNLKAQQKLTRRWWVAAWRMQEWGPDALERKEKGKVAS